MCRKHEEIEKVTGSQDDDFVEFDEKQPKQVSAYGAESKDLGNAQFTNVLLGAFEHRGPASILLWLAPTSTFSAAIQARLPCMKDVPVPIKCVSQQILLSGFGG